MADDAEGAATTDTAPEAAPDTNTPPRNGGRFAFLKRINKSQWVMILIGAATLVVGFLAYRAMKQSGPNVATDTTPPDPTSANGGVFGSLAGNAASSAPGNTVGANAAPATAAPRPGPQGIPTFAPKPSGMPVLFNTPPVHTSPPSFRRTAHTSARYTPTPAPAPHDSLLHISGRQGGNLALD